ncbi:hypothetical protein GUJ93_ZPchr0001g31657 [Zizania palustris]|uniref:Uncharacterized protein n=1 Tax=Zizania palustris TaxID=103762 RepID=A0A8J5S4M5_ZIZPA|nr:hypothetical protein GUJ93_ZPchr0001g31657 [Zizania palustris]
MTTMEQASKRKQLRALLVLSCILLLLLPLASSVPMSRSIAMRNHQASTSGLEAPTQVVAAAEGRNLGEVVARMDIEVNDYPGSGANNRHDPKSPGRA